MLKILLTLPPISLPPSEAAEYCFHGLKKLYPTMGIQLESVGSISDERGIERLGHWSKNSAMPETYNDEACVAELHTRSIIADAVNSGWQPAKHGCIPQTPRVAAAHAAVGCIFVVKKKGGAAHVWVDGEMSACDRVRCGFPDAPAAGMVFTKMQETPDNAMLCKLCSKVFKKGD